MRWTQVHGRLCTCRVVKRACRRFGAILKLISACTKSSGPPMHFCIKRACLTVHVCVCMCACEQQDARKCRKTGGFWISGAYGKGRSFAAALVMHFLMIVLHIPVTLRFRFALPCVYVSAEGLMQLLR